MISALTTPEIIVIGLLTWLALAFLTAPVVGKVIRGPRPEEPDLGDFIEERRAAEARTMAHVRRAQARREAANLPERKREAA